MASKELLGKKKEKQGAALGVLKEHESLDYEGLRAELELENDEMQQVMRGIKFNGLAKEMGGESGARFYVPDW